MDPCLCSPVSSSWAIKDVATSVKDITTPVPELTTSISSQTTTATTNIGKAVGPEILSVYFDLGLLAGDERVRRRAVARAPEVWELCRFFDASFRRDAPGFAAEKLHDQRALVVARVLADRGTVARVRGREVRAGRRGLAEGAREAGGAVKMCVVSAVCGPPAQCGSGWNKCRERTGSDICWGGGDGGELISSRGTTVEDKCRTVLSTLFGVGGEDLNGGRVLCSSGRKKRTMKQRTGIRCSDRGRN